MPTHLDKWAEDKYARLLRPPTGVELRRIKTLRRRYTILLKRIQDWNGPNANASYTRAEVSAIAWALRLLDPTTDSPTDPTRNPGQELF
jgi:hypothetical protein